MGTWRYSSEAASKAVWMVCRQNAPFLAVVFLFSFAFARAVGPSSWILPAISGVIALAAGLSIALVALKERFQSVEFHLSPESFACGAVVIPRHEVRQIASGANSTVVIGAQPRQAICITAELENYAGLCNEIHAWAPPTVERTTPVAPRRHWLIIPALIAWFAVLYLVQMYVPNLILGAMIGLLFASPILYFRQRTWSLPLRILASFLSIASGAATIWILT